MKPAESPQPTLLKNNEPGYLDKDKTMKPAEEVARKALWGHGQIGDTQRMNIVAKYIEAARREGAEWMREQAAELFSGGSTPLPIVMAIRALPTEPSDG